MQFMKFVFVCGVMCFPLIEYESIILKWKNNGDAAIQGLGLSNQRSKLNQVKSYGHVYMTQKVVKLGINTKRGNTEVVKYTPNSEVMFSVFMYISVSYGCLHLLYLL